MDTHQWKEKVAEDPIKQRTEWLGLLMAGFPKAYQLYNRASAGYSVGFTIFWNATGFFISHSHPLKQLWKMEFDIMSTRRVVDREMETEKR